MANKYYSTNRDGKHYPVIEVDVSEMVDEYLNAMDEYDFEDFIQKWMGHGVFLKAATKYMTEAYSSNNCETDTTNARKELLETLVGNRIGNAVDACAQAMRQKWYYETLYWQMYHGMSSFTDSMGREDAIRWNQYFSSYTQENPAPPIGSPDWEAYGKKAHEDTLKIIETAIEPFTKDALTAREGV